MRDALVPARQPSLLRHLALVYAFVALVALVVGAIVLHNTLANVVRQQHRQALLATAGEVLQRLGREGPEALSRPLSGEAARRFDPVTGSVRYVVLDGAGRRVLAASSGAEGALPRREPDGTLPESFREGGDGSRMWGVTRRVETPSGPVSVQVAEDMDRAYVVLDEVAPAALGPVLLMLALGAMLLLAANVGLVLLMLRPLRRAAQQAGRIGPGSPARLPEKDIPIELRPLIRAVNGGLDRLDDALAWQRGFSEEVAHELRTPLAIMQAELDLLEPSPARERLRRDVEGLAQLVTTLLEAAEAQREEPLGEDVFDLGELAVETARRLVPIGARDGHRVVAPSPDAPLPVCGNRDAMGRALRNLVENALTHSPPGAPVEVLLPPPASEAEVAVAVADRGPGVPPAERRDIFRRSWRTGDTRRRGLGLGLSIVERIVRAHGGRVEVGDTADGGATFIVTLPALRLPAEGAAAPPAAEVPHRRPGMLQS
jgi:two-component system sensor histidine kinase TctE